LSFDLAFLVLFSIITVYFVSSSTRFRLVVFYGKRSWLLLLILFLLWSDYFLYFFYCPPFPATFFCIWLLFGWFYFSNSAYFISSSYYFWISINSYCLFISSCCFM